MEYYVKVYSGHHDTERITQALKSKWTDVEWDVQACAVDPFLTGDEESDRGVNMGEYPMYKAFCGEFVIPEEEWVGGEIQFIYRGTKMAVL